MIKIEDERILFFDTDPDEICFTIQRQARFMELYGDFRFPISGLNRENNPVLPVDPV
jgi:hypothetical protein